jgi:hypothetical protein
MTKSRQSLDGKIVNIRRGLAIYKTHASPYYWCRVWLPAKKKRIVKTTKSKNKIEAIAAAEELFAAMGSRGNFDQTPKELTFEHFADKLVLLERARGARGEISSRQWQVRKGYLTNPSWGLIGWFGTKSVKDIHTSDYHQYLNSVRQKHSSLAPQTLNNIASSFSGVMKLARQEGIIDDIPTAPRVRRKDNPRAFFRFAPLVSKDRDEYKQLLTMAQTLATEGVEVRGVAITDELRDFILFMSHSFLRPTESEIYALRHQDITIADNPKRLIVNIRKGKTGHRVSNTMDAAVSVYKRICERHKKHTAEDFIFLPQYENRSHAKRVIQNQFNVLLDRCKLKTDRNSASQHSVYSLRHTAICMRLVLSGGKVNIFNLAKNAGTSVEQIERFYARNLPLSAELARNLQSFGDTP